MGLHFNYWFNLTEPATHHILKYIFNKSVTSGHLRVHFHIEEFIILSDPSWVIIYYMMMGLWLFDYSSSQQEWKNLKNW